jgi:hypothetical protein
MVAFELSRYTCNISCHNARRITSKQPASSQPFIGHRFSLRKDGTSFFAIAGMPGESHFRQQFSRNMTHPTLELHRGPRCPAPLPPTHREQ